MKRFLLVVLAAAALTAGCARNNTEPGQSAPPRKPDVERQMEQNFSVKSKMQTTPDLAGGPESDKREPQPLSLADLRQKYRSLFLLNGPSNRREVALTFDDAPDDVFTPQILDVLKQYGVRATFFVVGNRIEAHPDIVERMVKEGHVLGNHSYNHANLPKLKDSDFRDQILKTDRLIEKHAGYLPTYVRPPYGNINEDQIKWLASQHKIIINWNVDSLDWKNLNAEQVSTNVLAHVHPGAIILQHAGGGAGEDLTGTVEALPVIIEKLKKDGVKFVTVPELLRP
jgi:peptidoglycan/xylan/chitin deacetylase (PgdA/CDA1 family)